MKTYFKQIILVFIFLPLQTFAVAQTHNAKNNLKIGFIASSTAFENNGNYPKLYTCDGESISPTLQWKGAPEGTISYAISMHHIAKDGDRHVYMILYDLPATLTGIPEAVKGIGKWGTNTVNRQNEYAPPCSKGPGPKTYIITVYALNAAPEITVPASNVNMDVLLNAIKDHTLASSVIQVDYSR